MLQHIVIDGSKSRDIRKQQIRKNVVTPSFNSSSNVIQYQA